jgi:ADP-heptose:LPS heptosyltransferase
MKRLQAADKALGYGACALLQPLRWLRRPRRPEPLRAERVLLVKFWGIGSLQLLTPAVRTLRARHPEARLTTALTLRENTDFAQGLGVFDEVPALDLRSGRGVPGWARLFARLSALVVRLRAGRFDAVYDFEFFTRFSALLSLLTGARSTSGFEAPQVWRGGFHSRAVPFNRYWHVARNFRALAGEPEREVEHDELTPFRLEARDGARVASLLAERGLPAGAPFVVLNANAGGLSERRWPRRLASPARWSSRTARRSCWSARPPSASTTPDCAGAPPAGLAGRLAGELGSPSCARCSRAGALVSNDSGPMHMARRSGRRRWASSRRP